MYNFKSKEELIDFVQGEIINTSEAIELLGCSRQNLNNLVKREVIKPIKDFPRDRLFFKEDILNRKKDMDMKRASK